MRPVASAAQRLVCRFRAAWTIAVLVALFVPAALGPSTCSVARLLADQREHACRCGMRPGECGCRECLRLAVKRQTVALANRLQTVRAQCDDDLRSTASAEWTSGAPARLPMMSVSPRIDRVAPLVSVRIPLRRGEAPPTHPPRAA